MTSQVTSNDPAGMPPSRVALRLGSIPCVCKKNLTET